ncbi:MAG TPA: sn-glycerol-3-phosphate ABC transporter ATP-binding protein UgpC [Devosiaceae bacterium]|jgi:multiple sugar transport system ATP-binding protein
MASVNIENVSKSFGTVKVLHDVSIDIQDGEFVALVGPSGCGKSTLLRLLAGLDSVTSGEVKIGGRTVNDDAPRARDIAMVFQSYALYPHKTVEANLEFALKLRGLPVAERREKVRRAAEILNLEPLLKRYPKQLSGGQRQRVAMGRAIVRDPKVFLFDEPLSNLDAQLRVHVRGEIKELHERLRTTMIYVTHDQIEAMTLADKIVVLRSGRIEQIGSPLELFDSPCNIFVAGFLGSPSMNFLDGRIAADGKSVEIDNVAAFAPEALQGVLSGQDVILGIRPEHIEVADQGIAAEVTLVEPTGSDVQLVARLGSQKIIIIVHGRLNIARGDIVHLRVDPAQLHVFDKATGLRIGA